MNGTSAVVRQPFSLLWGTKRLAFVAFACSLFFDTGKARIAGLAVPMLMGAVLSAVMLLEWRMPKDRIVRVTSLLLCVWIAVQCASGELLLDGVRILSVLLMALAIGGTRADPAFADFQLRATLVAPTALVAMFYFGSARYLDQRMTVGQFGISTLAEMLAAGIVLVVINIRMSRGLPRWLLSVLLLLYLPPLWLTGSRKPWGIIAAAVLAGFVAGRRRSTVMRVALAAGVALALAGPSVVIDMLPTAITKDPLFRFRYVETLEGDYEGRLNLVQRGIDAVLTRPIIGHGLSAPNSDAWLAQHIGMFEENGYAIGTHNGLVDYAIMGGLPLLGTFLLLYGYVMRRLWVIAATAQDPKHRERATSALMLSVVFAAYIVAGDIDSKFCWWMFGFGLFIMNLNSRPAFPAAATRSVRAVRAFVRPVSMAR